MSTVLLHTRCRRRSACNLYELLAIEYWRGTAIWHPQDRHIKAGLLHTARLSTTFPNEGQRRTNMMAGVTPLRAW